jgi:hypothetical protein
MDLQTIRDYCLDLGISGLYATTNSSQVDNLLVWNDYGYEGNRQVKGFEVLDLTTGKIANVDGYEFLEWGFSSE